MLSPPRRYAFTPFPSATPDSGPETVVVVGAGPVGLATALGLSRRGVPVTVLEAGDAVSEGSRAICLSRHSLEILERLGLEAAFAEQALPWTRGRSYYRDTEVLEFAMPHGEGDVHPPMVNISQAVAEQIMVEAVESTAGCQIRWQCRLIDCTERDGVVTVRVATPQGERELRTRWLVAADGARSTVRELLGLRMKGASYEGRYVIADIHWRSPLPAERRVWFDPPSNPGSTLILHRQPEDIWRVDYQIGPGDDPAAELAEDRILDRITRHLDWLGNTEPWALQWSSLYRAHALSLDSYLHGRVLFAGDAAHLVPIFGVRGLNSGLEDADTLAWMLASVTLGAAPPVLLETYGAERRAAWRQNIDQAEKSTLFMTPATRGQELTRNAVLALATRRPVLRHLINPRQSSATHSRNSPLTIQADPAPPGLVPGDPVPDFEIHVGSARRSVVSSLHAERGTDFTVLGVRTNPHALEAFTRGLRKRLSPALRVRLLVIDEAETDTREAVHDNTGTLRRTFGAEPGEVFLIRPDGLLLARYPGADPMATPAELAEHILRGGNR